MNTARLLKKYGPWAVVTGASEGIGREFAVSLAAAGFNLVLAARRRDLLNELARTLTVNHRIEVKVVAVDLATAEGVSRLQAECDALEVGLLVAAAGFGTSGALLDSKLADEVQMLEVNCRAVLELSHHFGARFSKQRRGGLVLLSSLLAFQGVPRAAHYAATKAYIQSLAEGLRIELAPYGVDVIASAPGPIATGFARRANMQMNLTLTPAVVATATLAALGHSGTVRPGWLSKLLEWSLALLPRWGRVRVLALVMGGMTAHQAKALPT